MNANDLLKEIASDAMWLVRRWNTQAPLHLGCFVRVYKRATKKQKDLLRTEARYWTGIGRECRANNLKEFPNL